MLLDLGCEEDRPDNGVTYENVPGIGDITRCPLAMINSEANGVLRLYNHYKNGYLPNAGGINEQSASLMRAFEIIESAHNKACERIKSDG